MPLHSMMLHGSGLRDGLLVWSDTTPTTTDTTSIAKMPLNTSGAWASVLASRLVFG